MLFDAVCPPRLQETDAIADKLDEGSRNSQQTNLDAAVADGSIRENEQTEQQKRKQRNSIAERSQQQQSCQANSKDRGQCMDRFQSLRVHTPQVDAGIATVINLPPETPEIGTAFVPQPGLGKEAATESLLIDTDGKVNILAIQRHFRETRLRETAQLSVCLAANTQIKGARIELVQLFLATANAACGKKRCPDELWAEAVRQCEDALKFIRNPGEKVLIAAVERDWKYLQEIENPTAAVVVAAVKQDYHAFEYVSIRRRTEQVQLAAVRTDYHCIQYLQRASENVQMEAVRQSKDALKLIKNPAQAVKDFCA